MRRILVALLCALVMASPLTSVDASAPAGDTWLPTPVDELPADRSAWWPAQAELTGAREAAFEWLDSQQASDGTFGEDYGVTALAAFAMLNGGRTISHPVVARALAVVLSEAREDGSFSEGTYVHYYTSCAVMALSAGGHPQDEPLVRDGVAMLVREQCDGDEDGFEEWWRGGIGYGGDGRPDMSNTQFALMALAAAQEAYPSIEVPPQTWEQALLFLHRCQNLPEVNDMDWDDDTSLASYADGGFIYHPGRSMTGELESYGSMTAAGIWSLMASGEATDSRATAAAIDWIARHFSATGNPGIGDSGYYYYTWTIARALRSAGAPALASPEGDQLYWARELADAILARQDSLGSWMNTGSDRWWEGQAVVATCFALLALDALTPLDDAGFRVRAPDGARVTVRDPLGRRDAEIPGWSQEGDGTVVVGDASQGPFELEVKGADTVEVGTDVDGSVRVWRQVGLAREGGRMTVDVAPLLGPASLVVANVASLPPAAASSTTPGPGVVMAITAVALLAGMSALAVRRTHRGIH